MTCQVVEQGRTTVCKLPPPHTRGFEFVRGYEECFSWLLRTYTVVAMARFGLVPIKWAFAGALVQIRARAIYMYFKTNPHVEMV